MRKWCSVALLFSAFGFGLALTSAVAQEDAPGPLPDYYSDDGSEFAEADVVFGQDQKKKSDQKAKQKQRTAPPRTTAPPQTTAPAPTTRSRRRRVRRTSSSRSRSLSSLPEMFGDIFGSFASLGVFNPQQNGPGGGTVFDIPGAGGSRRVKVAENNRSLPTDRLIFVYNHFHNAGSFLAGGVTPVLNDYPIDRYTFGVEKTFFDEQWSLEVRLPFTGFNGAGGVGPSGPTAVDGGNIGNLSLILKHVVAESDDGVFAVGLGLDAPTGSDSIATIGANQLAFENQAFHLLPFLGASLMASESCFVNFFAQLDLALNGNTVELTDFAGARSIGKFNEQNLLYLDLGFGHWFFHDPDAERVTGLAGLVEL